VATFRIRLSSGLAAVQDSVRDLEASARVVRNFQPGIIPGLLQTAEYARQIMALADIGHHGSHAAAVAARLRRQQALHDPDRSFEFLLTEAALRYCPAPPQTLTAQPGGRRDASTNQARTAQLDHLAAAVTLETNSFGVIPADTEMHAITPCGFILSKTGPAAAAAGPTCRSCSARPARSLRNGSTGSCRPPMPGRPPRRPRPSG
jgi:hypothetical protein